VSWDFGLNEFELEVVDELGGTESDVLFLLRF